MSKSLATAKLYLKQRLQELDINKVSNLVKNKDRFNQIIGDLVHVKANIEDEDDVMALFCSCSPLLTALMCFKETISMKKVNTALLQTNDISKSISRRSYGNGAHCLEVISWNPRAFIYHNFLTDEECEHLISLAEPNLMRSKVRHVITGKGLVSRARTSSGTYLTRGHDEIVKEIERKISEFTFIPVENGEELQVIRYEAGQKFEPHFDGHRRLATVVMYLSDVEEGGETILPEAKGKNSKGPLYVSPKKGDVFVFWNLRSDGTEDPLSVHGSYPVIKGTKWAATKWFHDHELVGIVSYSRDIHEQR